MLIASLYSCTDDTNAIMLQREWKIVNTTPLVRGGVYIISSDTLDFRSVSNAKGQGKMYLQQIDERNFIKFHSNESYFEILKLTSEKLDVKLCVVNSETRKEQIITLIECEAIKE